MEENRNQNAPDYIVEFLIAEYSELSEEIRRLREQGINRLNFFITLTSAIVAGLVLLGQSGSTSTAFLQLVALGAFLFLLLSGWYILESAIARDVSSDFHIRATGRIRRFFVDHYPLSEKYLMWQSHDEPTGLVTKNTSVVRRTLQSVLSLLCALSVALITNLITSDLKMSITVGMVGFVIAFLSFESYARKQYKKASDSAYKSVIFPKMLGKDNSANI